MFSFIHAYCWPFTASRGVVCVKRISSLTLKRTNSLRVERLQRGINKTFCSNSVQSNHSGDRSLINCCVIGCFPFTWANRSLHGLGKWYAKFRTGKFRPGIAFTICTSQLHLLENDREDGEMEHEFPFEVFRPKTQDFLFRSSVAPGNFPLERGPKKSSSIYFSTEFSRIFL